MGSSRVTRLGASVLLSLALSVGIASTALGVSPTDPSPGRSSSASNADAQPATTGYTVSGKVYSAGGSALAGVSVQVQFAPDEYTAVTAADGSYTIAGVPGGRSYEVFFFDSQARYLNGCYDSNVAVSHFSINNLLATQYLVNANWTLLDVRLDAGVHITGKVVNTSGVALPGISVEAYVPTGFGYQEYTTTLADGTYSVLIAPNATYTVVFTDDSGPYTAGYYASNVPWSHLTSVYGSTTTVGVGTGDVALLNVGMAKPWSIVLGASSTTAVVGATVVLTATVNQDLDVSPYFCAIELSNNSVLSAPYGGGHTCTVNVSATFPTSTTFHAVVGYSDGSGAIATSSTVTVTWVPDHLVVTPNGASMAAGGSHAFTAEGFDGSNNDLGDVTASTNFTISGIGSCFLASCTSTFAGDHTVTGHDGSATGTATLHVTPAALNFLALSPSNATMAAGMSTTYTALGGDQYNNGTGDVTSATTFAISGGGSCTAAVCTTTVPGDHTITATDGAVTGTTTLHVTVGAINSLVLSPANATVAAGVSQAYTAQGSDAYGNSLGDVTSGTTLTTSGFGTCAGVSCWSNTPGTVWVSGWNGSAFDMVFLHVTPAAATHLAVSGLASPQSAGVPGSITVTALDAYGNTATGYGGTVHFSSSDGAAVLPADATLSAGVGTFSVTLKTAGTRSVTATDTVTSITGAQSGIAVNPAAATTLVVSGLASPQSAGVAGSITVTARDAYGNIATGYSGTVHFSSSDSAAILPANATLAAGVGTFSVTLKTAGTQSVTATDTVTSITGIQSGIVVNPAAVKTLVISGLSSPRTAGSAGSIRVTAIDAYGNRVHGYLGTVKVTSSDAKAKLPASYTFTAADAGTHVFSGTVILKTAGTQSVTATDTVTKTIKGSQSGIVVKPAAVKTLVVSGLTTPRTAGTTGNIRVTAVDAYGNRVSGYRGTVHFTSSDPKAKLPANYKFTAADAGTHVFVGTVILKTAGTQSVTATDMLTKTIKGAQTGIVVKAAAVKTLTVSGLTTPRTKGVAGTIRVTAVDAYGNRVSGYTGTVHFTSSDAKAKLPVNYKFKATDAGTHVFSVTLKTAGTQSVTATDTVTKTIKGSQTGIVVAPGVTFVSLPNPAPLGGVAHLQAQTSAGAKCTIVVIWPAGNKSGASGLTTSPIAGANGIVSWDWNVAKTTKSGTAKATVTCTLNGASGQGIAQFPVG